MLNNANIYIHVFNYFLFMDGISAELCLVIWVQLGELFNITQGRHH